MEHEWYCWHPAIAAICLTIITIVSFGVSAEAQSAAVNGQNVSVASRDLNGTWIAEVGQPGSKSYYFQKIFIFQVHNEIVAKYLQGQVPIAPGRLFFHAHYSPESTSKVEVLALREGSIDWTPSTLTVEDDDHLRIGNSPTFHRVSHPKVYDLPCDRSNPMHVSAEEAHMRGAAYESADWTSAACWFFVSAAQGDASAQASYGYQVLKGIGVEKNQQEGFSWIQKAAMQGDFYAEVVLANLFRRGEGTPADEEKASFWTQRAWTHPDNRPYDPKAKPRPLWATVISGPCHPLKDSDTPGEDAYNKGIIASNAAAYDAAVCWFRIGADRGYVRSNVQLGMAHLRGLGLPRDGNAVFTYMKKAADGGDLYGMMYLAHCYRYGIGTPVDSQKAWDLVSKVIRDPNGGMDVYTDVQGIDPVQGALGGLRALDDEMAVDTCWEVARLEACNNAEAAKEFLHWTPLVPPK